MKALVICAGGGIGDVLLATPLMRALQQRYDEIVALTTSAHREVLARQPMLSEVWVEDGAEFSAQSARIAAARFDAAVVTWATLRTAALPFFGRVPVRVGQARRLYSRFFTKRVIVRSELGDRETHWTQILLDFARALECDVTDATPSFPLDEASRAEARGLLQTLGVDEPFAILHPTRGIASTHARWPTHRLGELGRALGERFGARVLVSGSRFDAEAAASVAQTAGGISIAGSTSLGVFGALAERARLVVAMDSGPMHVAAAVGAPTVGIFALRSDEPSRWAPLGPRTAAVLGTYPCPPGDRKETCRDFACVEALEVERVLAVASSLLDGGRAPVAGSAAG